MHLEAPGTRVDDRNLRFQPARYDPSPGPGENESTCRIEGGMYSYGAAAASRW